MEDTVPSFDFEVPNDKPAAVCNDVEQEEGSLLLDLPEEILSQVLMELDAKTFLSTSPFISKRVNHLRTSLLTDLDKEYLIEFFDMKSSKAYWNHSKCKIRIMQLYLQAKAKDCHWTCSYLKPYFDTEVTSIDQDTKKYFVKDKILHDCIYHSYTDLFFFFMNRYKAFLMTTERGFPDYIISEVCYKHNYEALRACQQMWPNIYKEQLKHLFSISSGDRQFLRALLDFVKDDKDLMRTTLEKAFNECFDDLFDILVTEYNQDPYPLASSRQASTIRKFEKFIANKCKHIIKCILRFQKEILVSEKFDFKSLFMSCLYKNLTLYELFWEYVPKSPADIKDYLRTAALMSAPLETLIFLGINETSMEDRSELAISYLMRFIDSKKHEPPAVKSAALSLYSANNSSDYASVLQYILELGLDYVGLKRKIYMAALEYQAAMLSDHLKDEFGDLNENCLMDALQLGFPLCMIRILTKVPQIPPFLYKHEIIQRIIKFDCPELLSLVFKDRQPDIPHLEYAMLSCAPNASLWFYEHGLTTPSSFLNAYRSKVTKKRARVLDALKIPYDNRKLSRYDSSDSDSF